MMDEMTIAELLRDLNRAEEPDPEFKRNLLAVLKAEYAPLKAEYAPSVDPIDIADGAESDEEPPLKARPWKPGRGWRWQWAAVSFALVGVVGLFTFWLLPGRQDRTHPAHESTVPGPNTTTAVPEGSVVMGVDQIRLPQGMHPLEMTADETQIAFLVSSELQPSGEPPLSESELVVADRSTGDITFSTHLVGGPNGLALDDSGVWVTHFDSGTVSRIDRTTGDIVSEIPLELPFEFGNGQDGRLFLPNDIVAGKDNVWVSTARGAVAAIDKTTDGVQYLTDFGSEIPGAQVQGPSYISGMALLDGTLWIALDLGGVTRLDPATGDMTNVGLGTLDHAASQIFIVDGAVYAEGNRLERGSDGALALDGSYTLSDESAVSLLNVSAEPQASITVRGTVLFVGDIDGEFGALSDDGIFNPLDAQLNVQGSPSATNVNVGHRIVELDGEVWTMDSAGSQLSRVQKTAPVDPNVSNVRWSTPGIGMMDAFFPDNRLLAADDDTVFAADGWGDFSNEPRGVSAVSASTGEIVWRRTDVLALPGEDGLFLQLLAPDRLIVNGQGGLLAALNPATGETEWAISFPEGYNASGSVATGNIMYVGAHPTHEGDIRPPIAYAVDLTDGSVIWSTSLAEGTDLQPVAPALSDSSVLFSSTLSHPGSADGNMIHSVSRENGSVLWELNVGGEQNFKFFPTLIRGDVAIVPGPDEALGVSTIDGTTIWTAPNAQPLVQTDDGRALGWTNQGIAELDWETGETTLFAEVDWARDVYRPNAGLLVEDQLVVSDGRSLRAFSLTDGRFLWEWAAPGVIVDTPITVGTAIALPIGDQSMEPPNDRSVTVIESP